MNSKQPVPTISAAQCRAARGVLNLSQGDLCELAALARRTVTNFEAGAEAQRHRDTGQRLREVLEAQGVTFAPDGQGIAWRRPERA